MKNNSANVTVLRNQQLFGCPLTAYGERVLDAIAMAGGAGGDVQDVSVQLTREIRCKRFL